MPNATIKNGAMLTGILRMYDSATNATYDVTVKGNIVSMKDNIVQIALTEQLNWNSVFSLIKGQLISIMKTNILNIEG